MKTKRYNISIENFKKYHISVIETWQHLIYNVLLLIRLNNLSYETTISLKFIQDLGFLYTVMHLTKMYSLI